MSVPPVPPGAGRCPRTGRSRALRLPDGAVRPSDMLVAFFACAVAMLVVAAAVATAGTLLGLEDARWLALHLAFVGGVSQLVLGAAQFFVCAFLATDPPRRALLRAQLVVWNAAAVAIAVGVPTETVWLTAAGGAGILAGLALFAGGLRGMERRSLQRAPWATRWYRTAAGFFAAGALLGPVMAADAVWTHGSLLAAHMVLNLGGWFGTAIVGTLHTFHPSLTGTRLRRPELQRVAFGCWTAGIGVLALGCAFGVTAVAAAGWLLLLAAAGALGINVAASAKNATQQSAPALLVGAAQALLPAAILVALLLTVSGGASAALLGADRDAVAILLVGGWIGFTVLGSLVHLLALMARVRSAFRPTGPARGSTLRYVALASAAVLAVDALALARLTDAAALGAVATAALAALYAGLGARVVSLAVRAVRAAPLRV